nr:classical arabinogalactan protein 4-like [Aegilops tauschii subsp. strangulata]
MSTAINHVARTNPGATRHLRRRPPPIRNRHLSSRAFPAAEPIAGPRSPSTAAWPAQPAPSRLAPSAVALPPPLAAPPPPLTRHRAAPHLQRHRPKLPAPASTTSSSGNLASRRPLPDRASPAPDPRTYARPRHPRHAGAVLASLPAGYLLRRRSAPLLEHVYFLLVTFYAM